MRGVPGEFAARQDGARLTVVLGVPGAGATMVPRHGVLQWAQARQGKGASRDPTRIPPCCCAACSTWWSTPVAALDREPDPPPH
ncbi:hypothetical protein ACIO3O_09320 [Streptomyces sp. NPDC087440]|uniref:hypothetical protein n=1 Tax=Streptomyces sp. NPDC087440 TaxID=3365790 RepID=UPI0037F72A8A